MPRTAVPDATLLSIEALGTELSSRRLGAEEVTKACLERIHRFEPELHAFITVTAEDALAEARAADDRIAKGEARGPLDGVPVAVKDLFDTKGVRTTAGSRIFVERRPADDAVAVAKLRAAGAAIVGKTNLHEWAFGVTTQNPYFGGTRNPWDVSRIPGGSSGGSAAALAAGGCFGALGSDTGGSIRIPASLCGVVGLKPTYGRVSLRGTIPLSWTLDHAGPMARTVRDTAILYAAIAGYDALDPGSIDVPLGDALASIEDGVRGMRVGVPRGHFFERTDGEVARIVRDAILVLEREGALVEEVDFASSADLLDTQRAIISGDAAAYHAERLRDRSGEFGGDVLLRLGDAMRASAAAYAGARRRRDELRREVMRIFDDHDVLVTPATATAAPPAETAHASAEAALETARVLNALTSPFNLTGLPAISVPCGFTGAGLPVGLQIAGAAWREAEVLRAARAYERVTAWSDRRPPILRSA